jgi:DNA excision repair protein ERCC-4
LEEEEFNPTAFEEYFGLIAQEDLVVIRPYLGDEDDRILEELRPKYVVMFDPNPAFVRRIEVRHGSNHLSRLPISRAHKLVSSPL